jgi:hypothetical protein
MACAGAACCSWRSTTSTLGRNVLLVVALGSLYLAAYAHAWSQRRSPVRLPSLRASAEGR